MVRALCAIALVIAAIALDQRPVEAQAYAAPWCAVINMGLDVHWDCQYWSIEQCSSTVLAGNRGWCNPNPYYRRVEPQNRRYIRHRHYRQ